MVLLPKGWSVQKSDVVHVKTTVAAQSDPELTFEVSVCRGSEALGEAQVTTTLLHHVLNTPSHRHYDRSYDWDAPTSAPTGSPPPPSSTGNPLPYIIFNLLINAP